MLVEQIIKDTLELQGFRIVLVKKTIMGLSVQLDADRRFKPRCGVFCSVCGGIHREAIPWATGKHRLTNAFACFLANWARRLPWIEVSRLFRCAWNTIASAVKWAVAYGLANRDVSTVTSIGIDEISRRRRHTYVTNVYDLTGVRLVWSGEDRTYDTLESFFSSWGQEAIDRIQGICCDMWNRGIRMLTQSPAMLPMLCLFSTNFISFVT